MLSSLGKINSQRILPAGIIIALLLCGLIALTAPLLHPVLKVAPAGIHIYPWQLANPTPISGLVVWTLYLLHQGAIWACIYVGQRTLRTYSKNMRLINWIALGINVLFILLHMLQTQLTYDGLAQYVPEDTAFGSVAFMLMVVLILETPRRGLFFGRKIGFKKQFIDIVRKYHGYLFSWAIIYTFWYHPTEATPGHLAGFFYMFLLLLQSSLFFTRAHNNRIWTFILEILVLPHAVFVAAMNANTLIFMFAYGFLGIFVITQMHGLGLSTAVKRLMLALYLVSAVLVYVLIVGNIAKIQQITWIPVMEYGVVFALYLLYLGGSGLIHRIQQVSKASHQEVVPQ